MENQLLYKTRLPVDIIVKLSIPISLILILFTIGLPPITSAFYLIVFLTIIILLYHKHFALTGTIHIYPSKFQIEPLLLGSKKQYFLSDLQSLILAYEYKEGSLRYFQLYFLYGKNEEVKIEIKMRREDLDAFVNWANQKHNISLLNKEHIKIENNSSNVIEYYSRMGATKEELFEILKNHGVNQEVEAGKIIADFEEKLEKNRSNYTLEVLKLSATMASVALLIILIMVAFDHYDIYWFLISSVYILLFLLVLLVFLKKRKNQ